MRKTSGPLSTGATGSIASKSVVIICLIVASLRSVSYGLPASTQLFTRLSLMRRAVAMLAQDRKRAFSSLLNWENSVFSLGPPVARALRGRATPLLDARPFAMNGSNAARTRAALARLTSISYDFPSKEKYTVSSASPPSISSVNFTITVFAMYP